MTITPSFRRGADAIDAASGPSGGGSFQRVEYFSLNTDGASAILRFLTDFTANPDPVTGEAVGGTLGVRTHGFIQTKPAPADYKGQSWPQRMDGVCRHDPIFAGIYNDCYICDVMAPNDPSIKSPGMKIYALACLREEVRENGKIVGIRDQVRDVTVRDENGNESTKTEKRIVVVNQAKNNFFDALFDSGRIYGTLLDRDWVITRRGKGTSTKYPPTPLDPISAPDANGEIVRFDLRDDFFMSRYYPEALEIGYGRASDKVLEPVIANKASDDYYGRLFDPDYVSTVATQSDGAPQPENEEAVPPSASTVLNSQDEGVSQEALEEMFQGLTADLAPHQGESATEVPVASGLQAL